MNQFAKIRIEFTGLCSLVPHTIKPRACFVMVDGQRGTIPGTHRVEPLVAKDLDAELKLHWSFLRFPLRAINPAAPEDAEAVWYLRGHRIGFKAESGRSYPFSLDDDKIGDMDHALPQHLSTIDDRCLDATPPEVVGCQVVIDFGAWTADQNSANVFEMEPNYPKHTPAGQQPYTHIVFTELSQVDSLKLRATPFGGSESSLTLLPTKPADEATLTFANLCNVNPLSWPVKVEEDKRDVDFAWYYDLLPPGAKATVKGKLNGLSQALPIPKLTGNPSALGDNCNPNKFNAVDFPI